MLLPSSNRVAESDIPAMLPKDVPLHTTRLKLTGSTLDELLAMTQDVETAVSLLADAGVDLIAFHCTAVSTFNPAMERDLKKRIEKVT
jgi:maleate isomerase